LTLTVAGCQAESHIRKADAAHAAGRSELAVRHYRLALKANPRLRNDAELTARLRRAEALDLCDKADKLAQQGIWESAIDKYNRALEIDPQCNRADSQLAHARERYSRRLHDEALKCADQGQLDRAVQLLRRAVEVDGDYEAARQALAVASEQLQQRQRQANTLYAEASRLADQRRWGAAAKGFSQALAVYQNHVSARAALHSAKAKMSQSESGCRRGKQLLAEKALDVAIETLEESIAVWPFNEKANALMTEARAQRAEVQRLLDSAEAFRAESGWRQALDAVAEAKAMFPGSAAAKELEAWIRQQAATTWVNRGNTLLADGKLAEAQAAFMSAKGYGAARLDVAKGLAEVDYARGEAYEARGLWGQALLRYMASDDHLPAQHRYQARIASARNRIEQSLAFDADVVVDDRVGRSTANSDVLASTLDSTLQRRKPAYLAVVDERGAEADYDVTVTLDTLNVEQHLVSTESRTHTYTEHRLAPNRLIPPLTARLHDVRQDVRRLQRECNRSCQSCRGRGTVRCSSCGGAGHRSCHRCLGTGRTVGEPRFGPCPDCRGNRPAAGRCDKCQGTGHVEHARRGKKAKGKGSGRRKPCSHCDGKGERPHTCNRCGGKGKIVIGRGDKQCSHCRGRGRRPCRECDGDGRVRCRRCSGKGHGSDDARRRLADRKSSMRRLENRLRRMPSMVRVACRAHWPYDVNHYEKIGSLVAQISIEHRPTGVIIGRRAIERSTVSTDSTIDRSNSEVGLHDDGLDLPSDAQVRRALIDRAADEQANVILSLLLQDRRARLKAGNLADGNTSHAVEARVADALLLKAIDPKAAERQLDRLQRAAD